MARKPRGQLHKLLIMTSLEKIGTLWGELVREVCDRCKVAGMFVAILGAGSAVFVGVSMVVGWVEIHWFHLSSLKMFPNTKTPLELQFVTGMATLAGLFVAFLFITGFIVLPIDKLIKKWKEMDSQ